MAAPPPRPAKGKTARIKGEADDLASMAALDETILLEELGYRFKQEKIYTYVGDILVAVNPFKRLPLYTDRHVKMYSDAVKSNNPPHIFAIADQAFNGMKRSGKDQCAVVSGESGAGKTESAKHMIQHIINLSHTSDGASLSEKIIMVNPLLEAFGNAKTVMNNNSSRFGKYTQLQFDDKNGIIGAEISEYLLEKSRVISQNHGERNFHAFFYIFESKYAGRHELTSSNNFSYIKSAQALSDNHEMYKELAEAMSTVGFSGDEEENIHASLAGILHLGNIQFGSAPNENQPAPITSSPKVLSMVAQLLGVVPDQLTEGLSWSTFTIMREEVRKAHSQERSKDVRDALSKYIYGKVFSWIVQHINTVMAPQSGTGMGFVSSSHAKKNKVIGILDIFGFENFQTNGFEQMCINVTNEQLQNFFNKHIFENELAEYRKEGIDLTQISFVDNGPMLQMFFSKGGMYDLLDEETRFPQASDKTLVQKYTNLLKGKPNYEPNKMNDMCFTLKHYAGNVEYYSLNFLEKNRDTLAAALVSMCQSSENELIKEVFNASTSETGALVSSGHGPMVGAAKTTTISRRAGGGSLGKQFTSSLKILITKMEACQAHFIRCIKPNAEQAAMMYTDDFVNKQLSYTGMLETCRIRREGYSYRPNFDQFMERFGLLAFGPSQNIQASRATCEKVLQVSQLQKWLLGKTKVFLKYWHVEQLDKQLRRYEDAAVVVQKWVRRLLAQRYRERLEKKAKDDIKKGMVFAKDCFRLSSGIFKQLRNHQAADSKRPKFAINKAPAPPPMPELTEAELKREASIMWWREKERTRGAGLDPLGNVLPWFHGLISRKDAERLLSTKNVGCFLVRVSENRFGYTLSYRIKTRCRHYMVEQDTRGRYALVGVEKIRDGLNGLIEWFQRNRVNEEGDMLREPCGQEVDEYGNELCDFGELLQPGEPGYDEYMMVKSKTLAHRDRSSSTASTIPRSGTMGKRVAPPPPVDEDDSPPLPPVNRAAKKPAADTSLPPRPPSSSGGTVGKCTYTGRRKCTKGTLPGKQFCKNHLCTKCDGGRSSQETYCPDCA
eukprot:m.125302 g.125302  ORF g.125302 m.125302 type:complete len:1062 (+) comp29125_c0_seq1:115-3300(+)